MALRRCSWALCPILVPVGERYCSTHRQEYERRRGSASDRGYNAAHRAERERWKRLMARGVRPVCKRCGEFVSASDVWDLGHDDSRKFWSGPEHSRCNRSAGQANSVRMRERWFG